MKLLNEFFEASEEYMAKCQALPGMAVINELAISTEAYGFFNMRNIENILAKLYDVKSERPDFSALKILIAASEYAMLKVSAPDLKTVILDQFITVLGCNRKKESESGQAMSLDSWTNDQVLAERIKALDNQTEIVNNTHNILAKKFFLITLYGYVLRLPLRFQPEQPKA